MPLSATKHRRRSRSGRVCGPLLSLFTPRRIVWTRWRRRSPCWQCPRRQRCGGRLVPNVSSGRSLQSYSNWRWGRSLLSRWTCQRYPLSPYMPFPIGSYHPYRRGLVSPLFIRWWWRRRSHWVQWRVGVFWGRDVGGWESECFWSVASILLLVQELYPN